MTLIPLMRMRCQAIGRAGPNRADLANLYQPAVFPLLRWTEMPSCPTRSSGRPAAGATRYVGAALRNVVLSLPCVWHEP